MCGAEKEPPMDAIALNTTIKTHLADVRARLEKGLRIAKAAEACAVSGRARKGMEVTSARTCPISRHSNALRIF
jgi:hypothetical protein